MEEDIQLLQKYIRDRDEPSFRGLVERHGPLVRGVALRRTRDPELSDEITNSVFVLLARKASSVRESLRGWLYNAAFLESGNAMRKARIYQRKMEELRVHQSGSAPEDGEPGWDDVSIRLDEAMSLLESGARNLLIMRFYERKSFKEIADAVGKSEEASRKLITRSLERLNVRLRKKGLLTSVGGLTALLSANSLCSPVASASAIAARAMSAVSTTGMSALSSLIHMVTGSPAVRTVGLAVLIAAVPAGYYRMKVRSLEQEVATLRRIHQQPPVVPVVSTSESGDSVLASPSEVRKPVDAAAALQHGKDQEIKEATREVTRISVSVPDMTETQKEDLRALFARQKNEQAERIADALKSGAFIRAAADPENASAEDQSILESLRRADSDDSDPVRDILTDSQFSRYLQAKQSKRINSAESTASDSLKLLGRLFVLSEAQKDAIFQSIAQQELRALQEVGTEIPFVDPQRESARLGIIREHLSDEQTAVLESNMEEEKEKRRKFLELMASKVSAGVP